MTRKSNSTQIRGDRLHNRILKIAINEVFEVGFRGASVELIAAKAGVAKTTLYRRWPNKAAVVMDAFMMRVGEGTTFPPAKLNTERIHMQMRAMAKVFRSKDGALVKALLAESQFDAELAAAFRERWTLPRRQMAAIVFKDAVHAGELRPKIDIEVAIDLLYAPLYYRLQMGVGQLSNSYVDTLFRNGLKGLSSPNVGNVSRVR